MNALCKSHFCDVRSTSHNGIVLRIDSGASQHFVYDISLIQSFDEGASIVSFSTAAGAVIVSRAFGTVELKACDEHGYQRAITPKRRSLRAPTVA